ncbi:MAG: hypothetical protein KME35_17915 [Aphanocapsa sp. GSE-SYN-MK-11-07L]|jgi:hypothetical protein|nr:hypothetical protein [Aphanocapsa sp. GSE-SYN-MK-11-07L]
MKTIADLSDSEMQLLASVPAGDRKNVLKVFGVELQGAIAQDEPSELKAKDDQGMGVQREPKADPLEGLHGMDKLAQAERLGIVSQNLRPDRQRRGASERKAQNMSMTEKYKQLEGLHGMDKLKKAEELGLVSTPPRKQGKRG